MIKQQTLKNIVDEAKYQFFKDMVYRNIEKEKLMAKIEKKFYEENGFKVFFIREKSWKIQLYL